MSSSDDRLRGDWVQLRELVGRLVDELDPEGLLAIGVPGDEYAGEIDRLTGLLVHDDVSERTVLALWEGAFGPGSQLSRRPEVVTSLTRALLDLRAHQP